MNCPEARRLIDPFLEGKLGDDQMEDFLDHIETCENCYDELEVYYIVNAGIREMDENRGGTMNLKKRFLDKISDEKAALKRRKQKIQRRQNIRSAIWVAAFCAFMVVAYFFIESGVVFESFDDVHSFAVEKVQKYVLHIEPMEEEMTMEERIERYNQFKANNPKIPPYVYLEEPAFPWKGTN